VIPSPGDGSPLKRAQRRYRYLLGDSRKEAARLRAQGRLWDPTSFALFDRLGVQRGWNVLEIGPGQGSLHLELRKRVDGPVDAVESSPAFATRLRALCARDGLGAGRIWESDLLGAALPEAHYDLVFARWVFLFLPDPQAHLEKLVRALKPGGRIAVEDYYRETFGMIPRPLEWPNLVAADRAFFATQGGDASIGGRLPELFRRAGLEVLETVPTIKMGRPGSPEWRWLSDYFLGVLGRYAALPPFDAVQAARLRRSWLAAAREKTSVLIAPAVVDVVGRKPSRSRSRSLKTSARPRGSRAR
jgi:SAM-dependent methyltransferase